MLASWVAKNEVDLDVLLICHFNMAVVVIININIMMDAVETAVTKPELTKVTSYPFLLLTRFIIYQRHIMHYVRC